MNHRSSAAIALILAIPVVIAGQDRLKTMAGYDAAQRIVREAPSAITGAITGIDWIEEGRAFEYDKDGKRYRFEIALGRAAAVEVQAGGDAGRSGGGRGSSAPAPDRGRQFNSTLSPDGKLKAFYSDRNVWISDAADRDAHAVTTDGSVAGRIKYGT